MFSVWTVFVAAVLLACGLAFKRVDTHYFQQADASVVSLSMTDVGKAVQLSIPDIDNIDQLKLDHTTSVVTLNQRIAPTLHAVEAHASGDLQPLSCSEKIRVVVFNAERGRTWEQACQKMKSEPQLKGAQVYFLNEMDNGMARTRNENTTALLANCLGVMYVYGVEFVELTNGQKKEEQYVKAYGKPNSRSFHGNAILSAFPLENFEIMRLPGAEEYWHNGGFDGEYRLGGRMALFATLPIVGGSENGAVELVSTHLDFFVGETYNRDSMRLIAQQLKNRVGEAKGPTQRAIVAGDLGSPGRKSKAAEYLVQEASFDPIEHSHPSDCHLCSGDWLMLRGLPKVVGKHAVSSGGLSDHNFLSLELDSVC